MNSIKAKLLLVLMLTSLIPLVSLGAINFFQTTDIFTRTVQEYLFAIVKAKEGALENYIDSTAKVGEAIAATDIMMTYAKLTNKQLSDTEKQSLALLEKRVENTLYSFQETHWGRYHHIFLVNRSRRIVISPNHGADVKGSPSSHLNEDTSSNQWAATALTSGRITVSDYSSWVESDHSHQMLFYPIRDSRGINQAIIGFELQIPHETEILTENFKLGDTGRVFLVTNDGVPIVYKGIENQKPLGTAGINEARATGSSAGRRLNARGVDVIDLYLKNAKYPWILVAEIEADEAFRSLYGLQTILIGGLAVTLVLVLIFSLMFASFIVNPIRALTLQMEKISLGDFDIHIESVKRKDEIGKLIQAFQRLVTSLKIAMKQLQKKG